MELERFELSTSALQGQRSSQLSYSPKKMVGVGGVSPRYSPDLQLPVVQEQARAGTPATALQDLQHPCEVVACNTITYSIYLVPRLKPKFQFMA